MHVAFPYICLSNRSTFDDLFNLCYEAQTFCLQPFVVVVIVVVIVSVAVLWQRMCAVCCVNLSQRVVPLIALRPLSFVLCPLPCVLFALNDLMPQAECPISMGYDPLCAMLLSDVVSFALYIFERVIK